MTDPDEVAILRYLRDLLEGERRAQVRPLILSDFRSRAFRQTPERIELVDALVDAAAVLQGRRAAVLLNSYLDTLEQLQAAEPVDLLIVCPKRVELEALQLVLGRPLGEPAAEQHPTGRHFFHGRLHSDIACRDLRYTLVCLNAQTNMVSSGDISEILQSHPTRLAVLIGMAAGHPGKTRLCDVIAGEQILYVAPGTLRDDGETSEPDTFRSPRPVAEDFAAARPQHHRWFETFRSVLERAVELDVASADVLDLQPPPRFLPSVIVSVEQKIETTTVGEYLDQFSGDAKALDMEAGGFARACEKRKVQWVVLRGICDFGVQQGANGLPLPREKKWQLPATVAAATACIAWVTQQSLFYGRPTRP